MSVVDEVEPKNHKHVITVN